MRGCSGGAKPHERDEGREQRPASSSSTPAAACHSSAHLTFDLVVMKGASPWLDAMTVSGSKVAPTPAATE
jgi:hypothetical protein